MAAFAETAIDAAGPFGAKCMLPASPPGTLDQTSENGGKPSEGWPLTALDTSIGRQTGTAGIGGLIGSFFFGRGFARSDAWRPVARRYA